MELLHLPQSWQCSHHIDDGSIPNAFTVLSPPAEQSVPHIRSRPAWDLSPRRHEEQPEGEDDDYAWYYKHPERIIWRPRRSRLSKPTGRPKDKQFTVFDVFLNISRHSWADGSLSDTRDSMDYSETWSLLSSSTGSSTKVSEVGFPKH